MLIAMHDALFRHAIAHSSVDDTVKDAPKVPPVWYPGNAGRKEESGSANAAATDESTKTIRAGAISAGLMRVVTLGARSLHSDSESRFFVAIDLEKALDYLIHGHRRGPP